MMQAFKFFTIALTTWATALAIVGSSCCAADFMAGADISSLLVHEDHGAVYRDNGQVGDPIEILTSHGANYFRLRQFVNPQFKNNYNGGFDAFVAQDVAYNLELANRVKQAGGKLLLDFHYSDTWADPGHQWKPDAWAALTPSQLEQQVYDYTKQTIETFKTAGVLPDMVQIGNEIASGMLWDNGRLWRDDLPEAQEFDNLATLLAAGIRGARDGAGPGDEPLVMIHHDQGSRWSTTSYYFDRLLPRLQSRGTDPDVLGYSYYPIYHSGGITAVQQNLTNSANRYGKPVVIAEAGFPSRNPTTAEQSLGFPVTEAGQQAYLQALTDALANVPDGLGRGVFWWYAEARPTTGLNVWQNGRYSLFDQNGNINDAARVYEQFLPTPGDFNDDGFIDAADYTLWRDGFGTIYDEGDYADWQAGFGGGGGAAGAAPSSATVPEPAGLALLVLGASLLLGRRRVAR